MTNSFSTSRRNFNHLSDETRKIVSPANLDQLIEHGKLERDGNWYRVYDLRVLGDELYGLIKRIMFSREHILIKL